MKTNTKITLHFSLFILFSLMMLICIGRNAPYLWLHITGMVINFLAYWLNIESKLMDNKIERLNVEIEQLKTLNNGKTI